MLVDGELCMGSRHNFPVVFLAYMHILNFPVLDNI